MTPRKFILTKDVIHAPGNLDQKLEKGTIMYSFWGYVGQPVYGKDFLTLDPTGGFDGKSFFEIPVDSFEQVEA